MPKTRPATQAGGYSAAKKRMPLVRGLASKPRSAITVLQATSRRASAKATCRHSRNMLNSSVQGIQDRRLDRCTERRPPAVEPRRAICSSRSGEKAQDEEKVPHLGPRLLELNRRKPVTAARFFADKASSRYSRSRFSGIDVLFSSACGFRDSRSPQLALLPLKRQRQDIPSSASADLVVARRLSAGSGSGA